MKGLKFRSGQKPPNRSELQWKDWKCHMPGRTAQSTYRGLLAYAKFPASPYICRLPYICPKIAFGQSFGWQKVSMKRQLPIDPWLWALVDVVGRLPIEYWPKRAALLAATRESTRPPVRHSAKTCRQPMNPGNWLALFLSWGLNCWRFQDCCRNAWRPERPAPSLTKNTSSLYKWTVTRNNSLLNTLDRKLSPSSEYPAPYCIWEAEYTRNKIQKLIRNQVML